MANEYEALREGTWSDYDEALRSRDFDLAWQVLVHLALTVVRSERPKVEAAALAALDADSPALVRGALEALSILMRFRYRVDRQRYARATQRIRPNVASDDLVQDELRDVESWWSEPGWWPDPAVQQALEASPVRELLGSRPAAVLERIARGGGATAWYYCRDGGDLDVIEAALSPGSVVSFYFDDTMRLARVTPGAIDEMKAILERNGDVILAPVRTGAIRLEAEAVTHSDELVELVATFEPETVALYGATPARDNDGVNAVTITVPDRDGVVRDHPH